MPPSIRVRESCDTCQQCDDMVEAPVFSRIFEGSRCSSVYPAGATVFAEGQHPPGVYVVCQGLLKLTLTSTSGRVLVLRTCGPGRLIGVGDAVRGQSVQGTGIAMLPSEIGYVPAPKFVKLVEADPNGMHAVAALVSEEVRLLTHRLRILALTPSVKARLIAFLQQLRAQGRPTPAGIAVPFAYTQDELAEILGCRRETVGRLLVQFARLGAVERRGATLVLSPEFDRRTATPVRKPR
jgi:CRP-like cAMP-binding protein